MLQHRRAGQQETANEILDRRIDEVQCERELEESRDVDEVNGAPLHMTVETLGKTCQEFCLLIHDLPEEGLSALKSQSEG